MLVYEAKIDITGTAGSRRMPLKDLYRNDGMSHLTLDQGELVTSVHLPKTLAGDPSDYEKARIRGSIDFPLAGAAVRLRKGKEEKIEELENRMGLDTLDYLDVGISIIDSDLKIVHLNPAANALYGLEDWSWKVGDSFKIIPVSYTHLTLPTKA